MTNVVNYPATLEERIKELEKARVELIQTLNEDSVLTPIANSDSRWSVAEIAYHLYLTEKQIGNVIKMTLAAPERHERKDESVLQ
ncbi:MAG: hypothetical protein AB1489_34520, partial [Acidobacteriota bacterium]